MLAHKAEHEAVICVEKIAGLPNVHPMDKLKIPGCTYCNPQVASVGLTEAKAKAEGRDIRVGRFPSVANGLSRSESQILEVVAAGVRRLDQVFRGTQDLEDAPFLGDTSLWLYLSDLASGPRPLLRTADGAPVGDPSTPAEFEREVSLTDDGHAVRRREADWLGLRGGIDRWLGGVHLEGAQAAWRWDGEKELLVDMRMG